MPGEIIEPASTATPAPVESVIETPSQNVFPQSGSDIPAPTDIQSNNNQTDTIVAPAVENAKTDEYILTKLPDRNSAEYLDEFDKLSFDDSMKLEAELSSLQNGNDDELKRLMDEKVPKVPAENGVSDPTIEKDPVQGEGGEKPQPTTQIEGTGDYETINKEQFAKLDPSVQKTVVAMNKSLEEASPYMNKEFQSAMDQMVNDPVIKERMEVLKTGNKDPHAVGAYMQEKYNPNTHIDEERLKELDFKNPEKYQDSLQKFSSMLHEAAQKGHTIGKTDAEISNREFESRINTKVEIEKQLNEMVVANPSMKSDLAFESNDHPLASFFTWVSENNIAGKQFAKLGVKNVFTMYQSQSGGLKGIVEKQVQAEKKKLFLNLEEIDNSARSLSRTTQTEHSEHHGQMYKGIDMNRYKGDNTYRSRMYENADFDTQLALEKYMYTGDIPQTK